MTSEYPRDIDDPRIEMSNHALIKMKEREIGAHEIKKAITEGRIDHDRPTLVLEDDPQRERQIAYELELPISLWVIYDPEFEKVVTVFYDDKEGAVDGSITHKFREDSESVHLTELLN